jgi:hypothetical protein
MSIKKAEKWEEVCEANPLTRKMHELSEEVNAHEFRR